MNDISHKMRLIQSLDDDAHIDYSKWTGKWYVSARIEIGDGAFLSGITEHRDAPEQAVDAFLARLVTVDQHDFDHYLVTRRPCRHWRWNGSAFTEVSSLELLSQ